MDKAPQRPSRAIMALSWVITPIYILSFIATLLVFHVLQVIGNYISYRAHKFMHESMCHTLFFITRIITGARIEMIFDTQLPTDRPLLFVSNHQSLFDVIFFVSHIGPHHPKFVAKKELSRWIPGVSYPLRRLGSLLIDRSDRRGSVSAMKEFARYIEHNNYSAILFPEGTRARDGQMKPFKTAGLLALLKNAPSAHVVPVAISGSWEIAQFNYLPVLYGTSIRYHVLAPIDPANCVDHQEVAKIAEELIRNEVFGRN